MCLHASPSIACLEFKQPVIFSEGSYDVKPFTVTLKYDTLGKTGVDLKLKNLAPGLTVTNKLSAFKNIADFESVTEYLIPETNVHSSFSYIPVGSKAGFALSSVFKPTNKFTLGAELTGNANLNNLKLAVSDSVVFGQATIGARLVQDFSSAATSVNAYVGFSEGNTDALVSVNHSFAKPGLPKATFLVKHAVDKSLWMKAAVNDSLEMKIASGYKMSANCSTVLGFAVNPNAKSDADKYKVGLKATFAL